MEGQGFINDEKMAASLTAYLIESKGYGRYRVIKELTDRGICADLAESAYNAYIDERSSGEDDEFDIDLDNAAAALEKRMRRLRLEPSELDDGDIRRLTGFLHRRGFSFGTISRAFAKVREEHEIE
jgi:SOS response regulatory protein OraA/RecX